MLDKSYQSEIIDPSMAKESEKIQEETLQAVDAAIESLKAQDWDLNPYSVAAAAELAPEDVFGNKAAMDKILQARGDGSTYSFDEELAARCKELTAEMENAAVINQDLYDRGSELAERVVVLEANVAELEQEAETLAMQLQNSWSLGYQKGLAEGRDKLQAELKAAGIEIGQLGAGQVAAQEQESSSPELSDREAGSDTEDELPPQGAPREQPEEKEVAENDGAEKEGETDHFPHASEEIYARPEGAPSHAYNDQSFNAVSDHRPPVNVSEVYGALSWKQIETVYQYSTVAGHPNSNLYFEPLTPAGGEEIGTSSGAAWHAVGSDTQTPQPTKSKTGEQAIPAQAQADQQSHVQSQPQAPAQPSADQAAGAQAAPAPNPPASNPPAQSAPATGRRKSAKMPDISFDPPDEPIVGSTTSGAFGHDPINQYDGGLTGENYPSLNSMQAGKGKKTGREASATFDGLDALPATDEEVPDILDLDKLDIFEGIEDIDDLSGIEVIEDVIITSANGNIASQSETSAMPKVSSEALHDLIKSRIKQAQDNDPAQAPQLAQQPEQQLDQQSDQQFRATAKEQRPAIEETLPEDIGANIGSEFAPQPLSAAPPVEPEATPSANANSTTSTTSTTAASAAPVEEIDLEALRHGARNKFVGGKGASSAAPHAHNAHATGETAVPPPAASGTGTPRVPPVPNDIRKHCMILGVRPEDLTVKVVLEAWKAQYAVPGVHPDQGGDTETAVYLNLAKDTLIKYIETQAPKLGKKFGQQKKDTDKK